MTPKEQIRQQPTCDRSVVLYGFLRGCNLRPGQRVHLAGVGDFAMQDVEQLPDPCPLPDTIKKRGLNEQERLVYAPMSAVGGLLYDKDATYIDIPDWKVQYTRNGQAVPAEMQEVRSDCCVHLFTHAPLRHVDSARASTHGLHLIWTGLPAHLPCDISIVRAVFAFGNTVSARFRCTIRQAYRLYRGRRWCTSCRTHARL